MNVSKNTLFSIFLFSLPSIISSMIEPISSIVDTALIGNLDTNLLASLSIGVTLITTFTYVFNFIVHLTTSGVAKNNNNNLKEINNYISLALSSSLVIGVIASLSFYFGRVLLYKVIGVSEQLYDQVDQYFIYRSLGHVFVLLYISAIAVLRGQKKVNLALFIILITTLLNVLVSYTLIYHFDFGLKGAAIGTVLSNFVGFSTCLIILIKNGFVFNFYKDKSGLFHYSKDSLSLFTRSLFLSICFFYSTRQASLLGTVNLAAYQILINLWLFISFFMDGVAVSSTILVSEYFESKEFSSLKQVLKQFEKLTLILSVVVTIIFACLPNYIFSLFTYDTYVKKILFSIWPLIWIFQITNSFAFLYDGVMFGFLKFRFLAVHMIIGTTVFAYPFIYSSSIYKSLMLIFIGHILLNIYRMASCNLKIRSILNN